MCHSNRKKTDCACGDNKKFDRLVREVVCAISGSGGDLDDCGVVISCMVDTHFHMMLQGANEEKEKSVGDHFKDD